MKKFILGIFSVCFAVICAFGFVGCGEQKYSATTTDTTKVVANGGLSTVYNGELYFVNGTQTNDGTHNGGTLGSVYKVAIGDDGVIAENAKYTKVVDALVGQKNGSIFIFGNYLYYSAPSTGKNENGKVQYGRTKFYRKDLINGTVQEIYAMAGADESESLTYAYYKYGQDNSKLAFVIYEGTSKTLKSFEVNTQIKTNFVKQNVTSVVLSEKFGEGDNNADNFVFYTLAADTKAVDTTTNRVYRIDPDGAGNTLLCDNANISLLAVRGGKLILSTTFGTSPSQVTNIYAYPINSGTEKGFINVVEDNNSKNPNGAAYRYIISAQTYDDIIFVGDAEDSILVLATKNIEKIVYDDNGNAITTGIYTFASTPTLDFVSLYTDSENHLYLIFMQTESSKNYLYRLRLDEEGAEPVKISTTAFEGNSDLGLLVPKVVGDYVYAYAKNDDEKVLLYRAKITTPKADVDKAELVGGTKI